MMMNIGTIAVSRAARACVLARSRSSTSTGCSRLAETPRSASSTPARSRLKPCSSRPSVPTLALARWLALSLTSSTAGCSPRASAASKSGPITSTGSSRVVARSPAS